mgnify:FL=1
MILKHLTKNFYLDLILIFSIFLFDRLSKLYVIYKSEKNGGTEIYTSKFLNIQLVWNEGIAFGLFSIGDENRYNIFTILILLVIIVIFFMAIKNKGLKKIALMIIFAGALGNLYDRISYKSVADFIDFHVGNFHWFIFNIADTFITLGVIIMILLELIDNKDKDETDDEKI